MALDSISTEEIKRRMRLDNPWWTTSKIAPFYGGLNRRLYYPELFNLSRLADPRRAVVLMGPRRVGKTVLLFHVVQGLIDKNVDPRRILYLSLDTPVYSNHSLEELFSIARSANDFSNPEVNYYVIFDEIQYLKDWEVHLKSLVDTYLNAKFIASGSAAAALKLKSQESGAGRFTDFNLPPLTFHEYIHLKGLNHLITPEEAEWKGKRFQRYATRSITELNEEFVNYINFGGYPEVSLSSASQMDPARYMKSDIIDKVLQRDLPVLYGIQDVLELNRLFTTIAFNTGNEFSYETLTTTSGVSMKTIRKYISYLEAAFLIKVVHRIDGGGKKFKRANFFKIYLTNPSLRSGLFSPAAPDAEGFGNLVETAVFSQWFHRQHFTTYYARWKNGEVDIVGLNKEQLKPSWAVEVKWSDLFVDKPNKLKSLRSFTLKNGLHRAIVTTRSRTDQINYEGLDLTFIPAALYAYTVGRRSVQGEE